MEQPSKRDQRRALFFRRWLYWVLITTLVLCVIGLGVNVAQWLGIL